jgi:hypothetical protein
MHVATPGPNDSMLFIGCEHELRRLQLAFAAAVAGRGGVLRVAGEPGIGKTDMPRVVEIGHEGAGIRRLAPGRLRLLPRALVRWHAAAQAGAPAR